jgi:sugar transferase (PEP-CTERM/EpsH1 system associated)
MAGSPPLVLHVIHHLVIGGMENGLVNLINRMPPSEFRHGIVCIEDHSDFRNRLERDDVEVVALHRSKIGIWKLRQALYKLFRDMRPSLVHSRNLSGLDALLPARLAGVPYCVHGEHGRDVDDPVGDKWKFQVLRQLHSPLIDRYITVSADLKHYLVNKVGISATRVAQIYNGVDTERFSPWRRQDNGKPYLPPDFCHKNSFVIGAVGRMQPVKDHLTLVRAFIRLVGMVPEGRRRLRLVIIGNGPLWQTCQDELRTAGLAEIAWLPGARNDVPELLRTMDLFVLPSLAEGLSNTVLEAMATGLPVLATRVGGNPELLEDGVTGQLVPPENPDALAQALLDYVDDPARLTRQGSAARTRVEANFSMDAMMRGYLGVYNEVLARR